MKNYVKPILEINMFDTEEILLTSGVAGQVSGLSSNAQSVLNAYNEGAAETDKVSTDATVVEFEW